MSAIFKMYLMNVAVLLVGVISTVILKDCTFLVICAFLFIILSVDLNAELVDMEEYLDELETMEEYENE